MPSFPRYNSRASITTERPGPLATGAAERTEAIIKPVQDVLTIGQKLSEAQDTIQFTTAKDNYEVGLADIVSRAEQDPDYNSFPKYVEEMKKLKEKNLRGFNSKLNENKAALDFDTDNQLAAIKLQNVYRKKQIEVGQVKLQEGINALTLKNDPKAEADIRGLIDLNVKSGIITPEDGTKLFNRAMETTIEQDILANPEYALQKLQKGDSGAYKSISPDKRIDLIKQAEERINKVNRQREEAIAIATNQREAELIDAKISGSLNEIQVKQEREAGNISAQFADAMINALRSPKTVGAKTDDRVFNKIAEDIVNIKDKKPSDIRNILLAKNASGELNDEDFKTLYTFNEQVQGKEIDKALNKKAFFQRLMTWDWSPEVNQSREEVVANMFKQYMAKVNAGEDPATAVSEITSQQLDAHLAEQRKYPNRQYGVNQETKQRIYSDDGGNTWHDEKTGALVQ